MPPDFVPLNLNFSSPFYASSVIDMLVEGFSSSLPISVNLTVKLDDHNHMIWKDQIMTYVTTYGLEEILDGSLTYLQKFIENSTFPNSIFLKWNRLNSSNDGSIINSHLVCLAT